MSGIDFTQVFILFLVLVLSLTVHEAAHAWSADRLGDPTARLLGRVSFNPAVHVDPIGTIVFPLVAIFTGVPLLGWAKPVPVNTLRLGAHWKRKFMIVAAAGPASNLVLATIAAVALKTTLVGLETETVSPATANVLQLLIRAVQLNVGLAVFNMIPIPPLDGGNVLSGLLPAAAAETFDRLRPYGFLLLYALMFSGVLAAIIAWPENLVFSWLL